MGLTAAPVRRLGWGLRYSAGIQRITRQVLERLFADMALVPPSMVADEAEKDSPWSEFCFPSRFSMVGFHFAGTFYVYVYFL